MAFNFIGVSYLTICQWNKNSKKFIELLNKLPNIEYLNIVCKNNDIEYISNLPPSLLKLKIRVRGKKNQRFFFSLRS